MSKSIFSSLSNRSANETVLKNFLTDRSWVCNTFAKSYVFIKRYLLKNLMLLKINLNKSKILKDIKLRNSYQQMEYVLRSFQSLEDCNVPVKSLYLLHFNS